jgi:hypothetical protein
VCCCSTKHRISTVIDHPSQQSRDSHDVSQFLRCTGSIMLHGIIQSWHANSLLQEVLKARPPPHIHSTQRTARSEQVLVCTAGSPASASLLDYVSAGRTSLLKQGSQIKWQEANRSCPHVQHLTALPLGQVCTEAA